MRRPELYYAPSTEPIQPRRLREVEELERRVSFEERGVWEDTAAAGTASPGLEVEPSFTWRHGAAGSRKRFRVRRARAGEDYREICCASSGEVWLGRGLTTQFTSKVCRARFGQHGDYHHVTNIAALLAR